MIRLLILSAWLTIGFQLLPHPTFAYDLKAREIMQRVDERDDGDNSTSLLEMILIDKNGRQRVRKLSQFSKDKGKDTLRILLFQFPVDVKDTGFLTYDYDDPSKDDDQTYSFK